MLASGAALFPASTVSAQQAAPNNILAAGAIYKDAADAMARLEHLPCLDPFTRSAIVSLVETAIEQLGAFADAEGDKFITDGAANNGQAHAASSVTASRWADTLQRSLSFIASKPNCKGPFPWDPPPPGGGGLTDGPNSGWPEGVTPPSRTQIPECKNATAEHLIDLLQKKIPEENAKIKSLNAEMDALRDEIIQLLAGQASAKRKGQPQDSNTQAQIESDQARYEGLAFQLRSVEIQQQMDKEDLAKLEALPPCNQHSYYDGPRGGTTQYVTYATDSTTHCTYTGGTFTTSVMTMLDDGPPGAVAPGPDVPPSSGTPPASGSQTAVVPDRPEKLTDRPTNPPMTPPTTDITPTAPDDAASDIPDDAELKVRKEVVEGGQTGDPLEGQTIKLTFAEKSDLPVPVDPKAPVPAKKTALDLKFDKSPDQCTTDAKGGCNIQIATDDRSSYRLPSPKKGVHRTYQLEIARPQTSGGIAELMPGKDRIDPKALQSIGSKIVSSTFKIGNRAFIRFALETKYGIEASLAPKLKEAYGPSYEEDICREKDPSHLLVQKPLGAMDAGAPELAGTIVRLHSEQTRRRVSR